MRHAARSVLKQGLEHPYIHAVALATAWSALLLLLSLGANPLGFNSGIGITLAVTAVAAATLIITGIQWVDRVIGAGIEFAGQLLIAVVWVGDIIILWGLLDRPWADCVVPVLFTLAALGRGIVLWRRVRRLKKVVDDLPDRPRGVAWAPRS